MAAADPVTRRLTASIGGNACAAKHDGKTITASARRGFMARFEREVDPEGRLSPAERAKRAEAAMRAHMARLSLKAKQRRAA